jgi:hypothetical protein
MYTSMASFAISKASSMVSPKVKHPERDWDDHSVRSVCLRPDQKSITKRSHPNYPMPDARI